MLTSIKLIMFQRTIVLFTRAILCKHAHEKFEPRPQIACRLDSGHCCPLKHYCSHISAKMFGQYLYCSPKGRTRFLTLFGEL